MGSEEREGVVGGVELKCAICGKKALGVASSPMVAMSRAICRACIEADRVTWGELVGGLYGCTADSIGGWVRPIIKATCKFYNKTEAELWRDVQRIDEEYEKYMQGEDKGGLLCEACRDRPGSR